MGFRKGTVEKMEIKGSGMNPVIYNDMVDIYDSHPNLWAKLKNTTVMITGAYGMLAAYMTFFLIYLNEEKQFGITIISVSRSNAKLISRFGEYVEKDYFVVLNQDVCSPIKYDGNIDYIVHAASPASSQYYFTNPVGVLMPNILGTYNTLEFAKEKKCDGYLYFSSGEVYGRINLPLISEDDSGYLNPADVRSCYGEGKRAGETMCKCYAHQYGVHAKMVRPSHTYGPTMDIVNDNRVFSEFVSNIVEGKNIIIKSDGLASRNFCYIADAVKAYFMVMLIGADGEPYNVANESGKITIRELAELLCSMYPEKNLHTEYQQHDASYAENIYKVHSMQNTKKLRNLGWNPRYSIEEGFRRTIDSFESVSD